MSDAAKGGTPATPRRGGRPRKADRPIVPWDEVDRILVFGETACDEETGQEELRYPSYRELGQRYGISSSLISRYASRHQCMRRREENQRLEQMRFEQKLIERRAEARALATEEAIEIVDDYMRAFRAALADGRVRADSASDFNTMARLKEFLGGKADARQEVHGVITLQQLQERHQAMRAQLASLDPVVAGTVAAHEPGRGRGGEDSEKLLLEERSRDTGVVDPVLAGLERPRRAMPATEEPPRRHRQKEEKDDEVADEAARDEELARELARRGKVRRAARVRRDRDERADLDDDDERPRSRRVRDERAYRDDDERPRVRRNVEAHRSREEQRPARRARGERAAERMAPERRRPRLRGDR